MFKNPISLSKSRHQALRLTARLGYDFALEQNAIPIVMGEVVTVAREYAIVFSGEAGNVPLALTGLPPGRNAYVTPSGDWLARYVPAHLRRYPFVLAQGSSQAQSSREETLESLQVESDRSYVLQFDEFAPHLSDKEGMPLFDGKGEPTEVLRKVQQALLALQQDFERTRALVGQLDGLGLLVPRTLRIQPREEAAVAIAGFRVIDGDVFRALDGDSMRTLRDSGALTLIFAHLISLNNLRDGVLSWGAKRRTGKAEAPAPTGALGLPGDETLDFDGIDWSKLNQGPGPH